MSTNLKVLIAAIVIIVVGGGLWWQFGRGSGGGSASENSQPASAAPVSDTLPTGSSTSDASLQTDLNAIDTQINSFGSDNASVQSGLTDQPVQQSSL
ncbi:hypothetical protein KGQ55_03330 [Patescibacteria group bacterium]|nr:hypothetical protein [Patescibacteria group bacterium]